MPPSTTEEFERFFRDESEAYIGVDASISEMVSSQLPGRENGPADAYRHLIWAAEMSRRFGPEWAAEILELHEREGVFAGQTVRARAMDEANNEIGILIGQHARTWDDVVRMARAVIDQSPRNGDGDRVFPISGAAVLPPDVRGRAAEWLPTWTGNPVDETDPNNARMDTTDARVNWNRPDGQPLDWAGTRNEDPVLNGYAYKGEDAIWEHPERNPFLHPIAAGFRHRVIELENNAGTGTGRDSFEEELDELNQGLSRTRSDRPAQTLPGATATPPAAQRFAARGGLAAEAAAGTRDSRRACRAGRIPAPPRFFPPPAMFSAPGRRCFPPPVTES